MTANVPHWTAAELAAISQTEEVHVSSIRGDGTLDARAGRSGRSWLMGRCSSDPPTGQTSHGSGPRRTAAPAELRVGDASFDVTFHHAAGLDQSAIEAEYRRKYRHRPAYNINRAAGSTATLQLLPQRG